MTLWVRAPHFDLRALWFYGKKVLVSHLHARYVGHRDYGSADILTLVCHGILPDHMIKGSCNFIAQELLKVSYNPAKFVCH